MSSENKSESADSQTCDYDTQYEHNNDEHNSAKDYQEIEKFARSVNRRIAAVKSPHVLNNTKIYTPYEKEKRSFIKPYVQTKSFVQTIDNRLEASSCNSFSFVPEELLDDTEGGSQLLSAGKVFTRKSDMKRTRHSRAASFCLQTIPRNSCKRPSQNRRAGRPSLWQTFVTSNNNSTVSASASTYSTNQSFYKAKVCSVYVSPARTQPSSNLGSPDRSKYQSGKSLENNRVSVLTTDPRKPNSSFITSSKNSSATKTQAEKMTPYRY